MPIGSGSSRVKYPNLARPTGKEEARASDEAIEGFIASSPSSALFGSCVEKMGAADAEIEELLDRKKSVKNPLVPVGTSPPLLFPFSSPNPPSCLSVKGSGLRVASIVSIKGLTQIVDDSWSRTGSFGGLVWYSFLLGKKRTSFSS